jgi:glycosyltransferase involved in cell wall biosynthesis
VRSAAAGQPPWSGGAWQSPKARNPNLEEHLKVGVVCPVWFPVPPEAYGGIERVVALLADGLVDAGHDVTLFASGDSQTRARLDAVFPTAPSEWIGHTFWELRHMIFALRRSQGFDVIHDHTGLMGLALGGLVDVPFCHTVHGPLDGVPGALYEDVLSLVPRAKLISISLNQRAPKPSFPWIANCPNALDLSMYPYRRKPSGDYLVFLGRMSPDKGAHRALAVALETGLPLKIAAKCREPAEIRYFDEFVRPHLGESIEYVGEVGHADKVELLLGARALVFPIDWEEPFGLVVIEAMACGTPVIATRRGAIPEIIEHGRTGILVDSYREMEDAKVLEAADRLDPQVLRREVEDRFSPEHMVANYVAAYEATIEATAAARA